MDTINNSKIFLYVLLFFLATQLVNAHGAGGSEESVIGEYLIEMEYSEKPLNIIEPVLFTFSLKNSTTRTLIEFNNMHIKLSDSKNSLLRTQLVQDFTGRASFTYTFPHEDSFLIEIKFNNNLQTLAEAKFTLDDFALDTKKATKKIITQNTLSPSKNNVVEVLITDDAFEPKQITITKGTNVTWKNIGENFHWPASDFHPTHGAYPTEERGCLGSNFDACLSLKKGETYSFVFEELGSWSAHDHLYPGLTMQIDVVEELQTSAIFSYIFTFFTFKNSEQVIKPMLPTDFLALFVFEQVPELIPSTDFLALSAFEQREYFEELSAKNPLVAWEYLKDTFIVNNQVIGNAHELAHTVGNALYKQFGIKGIQKCDPAFSFGCYHGVTEKLLTESGIFAIKEIEKQCMDIFSGSESGETPSCVHGIGHGLLTMNGLNIDKSLNDCDLLIEYNRQYCYDGVFMEHQLSSVPTKIDPEKPWAFCENFNKEYIPSCTTYHLVELSFFFNNNMSALATTCESSPTSLVYETCYRSLGLRVGQLSQGNPELIERYCSSINKKQGKDTCTIFAAVETIFQEFSGWQDTYKVLCNSLRGNAFQSCHTQTKQVISAYGRDASTASSQTVQKTPNSTNGLVALSPEIEEIKKHTTVSQRSIVYRTLLERVGPEQAQEELYLSGLPFTGETHLLNHVSGEYIFEKFGAAGLPRCKDYFLSSCYHGFVIQLIAEEGLPGVTQVLEECQKVGRNTLSQCMHAIGHGFVSWVGYENLPQALELCDTAGEYISNPPLQNCYDGAFMENVWGVHDGAPSPDRWVDDNDPLYPCYDSRIDSKYRLACLGNTAALMLIEFKDEFPKKSGELCLSISALDERSVCFNGLARQIHPLTYGQADKAYEFCTSMPEEWIHPCLIDIARADISVGGRELAFEICDRMDENTLDDCYSKTLAMVSTYS